MRRFSDTFDELEDEIEHELAKRAKRRQMTKAQEVFNALTMLPYPLIGLYFTLTGKWLFQGKGSSSSEDYRFDDDQCIFSSLLPDLYAAPPIPTLAIVLGLVLHSPCSIYYHLLCAFKLPPGPERLTHWSRRLDQSMIHVMSFLNSYGSSGSVDYTILGLLFALDSIYHLHHQPSHKPLVRMIVAFAFPILPLLTPMNNGYFTMEAMQLIFIYSVSGWLFVTYPFGGWSHGIFHLVCAFSIPVTLSVSTKLEASNEALLVATRCAGILEGGTLS